MNVYPREIEEHIHNIKGVEAAAVISVPDEDGDEIILAYIKKDPDVKLTEKDVKAYLKNILLILRYLNMCIFQMNYH